MRWEGQYICGIIPAMNKQKRRGMKYVLYRNGDIFEIDTSKFVSRVEDDKVFDFLFQRSMTRKERRIPGMIRPAISTLLWPNIRQRQL